MAKNCSNFIWNIIHWIRFQNNALSRCIREIWRKNYGAAKTCLGYCCLRSALFWLCSILWCSNSGLFSILTNLKCTIFHKKRPNFDKKLNRKPLKVNFISKRMGFLQDFRRSFYQILYASLW